jgi:hypothetical protein
MKLPATLLVSSLAVAMSAGIAGAGTVLVNGDEWTLSNAGFAAAPAATQFVANMVAEFGPTIHAYSNNFGYTQSNLAAAMVTAGATYTTGTGITFDLPTLQTYDAIFLGAVYLSAPQKADLSSYVAGGGNVYISAGTGVGGPAVEAAAWNDVLAPFGIMLGSVYTGFIGNVTTVGDPLFAGVGSLYIGNPNGVVSGSFCCTESSVFAVNRMDMPAVPVPAAGLLLGSALAMGAAGALRRRLA